MEGSVEQVLTCILNDKTGSSSAAEAQMLFAHLKRILRLDRLRL
jgi:hypothetical protein